METQKTSQAGTAPEQANGIKGLSRRDFIRGAVAVVGTVAAGTAVAGCGATPTAAPTPAPAGATAVPAKPTTAPIVATPVPAATAAPAKTKLVLAQGIDPKSLWSSSSTAQQEINVSEQITEKLFEFTEDSSDSEPRLATEMKQLDSTTLQIKLRPGIQFTNGEPFDADSVKFSLEVMAKSVAYAYMCTPIASFDVVDKLTLNVKLKYPTLLHKMAITYGSFQYPPKYFTQVGEVEFGKKPIGTGPYKFVEWVKDSQVTLEANANYWRGAPAIKTVVFRNIPEGAAKLAALETGEVDFIIDVPLDSVERIERNTGVQLYSRPSLRLFNLTPSMLTDTPLKLPKVRQALWSAVDVNGIITALFKGRAKPLASQFLVQGYFGFDTARKPAPYDPEKAKKLLAEAGFPNGIDFTFKYSAGRYAQDKEVGQAVSAQLAKVGIRAKQEVLESGTFLTQLTTLKLNDMYFGGSLPPPDIDFMYANYATGGRYVYYKNTEFDALYAKGKETASVDERMKIYMQIHDLMEKDPAFVPLYQPEDYYGGSKKLTGFKPRANQFLDVRDWKFI
jgi:peptide/nickel transport system substrate-binding protein